MTTSASGSGSASGRPVTSSGRSSPLCTIATRWAPTRPALLRGMVPGLRGWFGPERFQIEPGSHRETKQRQDSILGSWPKGRKALSPLARGGRACDNHGCSQPTCAPPSPPPPPPHTSPCVCLTFQTRPSCPALPADLPLTLLLPLSEWGCPPGSQAGEHPPRCQWQHQGEPTSCFRQLPLFPSLSARSLTKHPYALSGFQEESNKLRLTCSFYGCKTEASK